MMKRYGSVEVNTESGQLFQNGIEVQLPYDIARAFDVYCTFEYMKDNYTNSDDTLWQLACEVRQVQFDNEANGYPITEGEAIEIAANNLSITLMEV